MRDSHPLVSPRSQATPATFGAASVDEATARLHLSPANPGRPGKLRPRLRDRERVAPSRLGGPAHPATPPKARSPRLAPTPVRGEHDSAGVLVGLPLPPRSVRVRPEPLPCV